MNFSAVKRKTRNAQQVNGRVELLLPLQKCNTNHPHLAKSRIPHTSTENQNCRWRDKNITEAVPKEVVKEEVQKHRVSRQFSLVCMVHTRRRAAWSQHQGAKSSCWKQPVYSPSSSINPTSGWKTELKQRSSSCSFRTRSPSFASGIAARSAASGRSQTISRIRDRQKNHSLFRVNPTNESKPPMAAL